MPHDDRPGSFADAQLRRIADALEADNTARAAKKAREAYEEMGPFVGDETIEIDDGKEPGSEAPMPHDDTTELLTIPLTREQYDALQGWARERGITAAEYVRRCLVPPASFTGVKLRPDGS